ncbi:MAG: transposase [Luteolibacter sp.]|nr:transposase [Luteolibacter sp.]
MARGNGGDLVFVTDDDRKVFLHRLGQVCESHGWLIHAWVLMGNHFHLLLETPQPNLVSGMKWLLSTYSQGWNRARMRRGHVFQGRYKAVPVNASDSDPHYFKALADYIHLNPSRAGLAGGKRGPLLSYPWSSLPSHHKGNGPAWLESARILRAFQLAQDGRGRRAYVAWLEARASQDEGKIDEKAMEAIRRGWYLGKESFKDKLLNMLEKPQIRSGARRRVSGAERDHGEKEALRIVEEGCQTLGLPAGASGLDKLKKTDPRKVRLAILLRSHTSVSNAWIAERLAMGHPGSVSRSVSVGRSMKETVKDTLKLGKMLKCVL